MARLPSPVGPLTVYYDDMCAMCLGSVEMAGRRDHAGLLRPEGLSSGRAPFSEADLVRELHAVDAAGRVYRGYDAAVAMLATMRGLSLLAPLLATSPARRLGHPLYRFIARHRRRS